MVLACLPHRKVVLCIIKSSHHMLSVSVNVITDDLTLTEDKMYRVHIYPLLDQLSLHILVDEQHIIASFIL